MRPRLIAGNWKMHKTISEAKSFVRNFLSIFESAPRVEVVMAPPYIALPAVHQALQSSPIGLAAQNLFGQIEGAFTGEVSAPMLKDLGCTHVIIGHSERRQHFHETNTLINEKVHAALQHGLHPIFCVGERLEQREAGQTESVISNQIIEGLQEVEGKQLGFMTIAYEPVWAIGTGRAATVEQAAEVHSHIRNMMSGKWAIPRDDIRILYGGSVSAENAGQLFQSPQINGALVGKACLNPESFAKIISLAE